MGIMVVGLSHKTAPIEIRERLSIPADQLGQALADLKKEGGIKEAVLLSTCNRLEVYARPESELNDSRKAVSKFFHKLYNAPNLEDAIYHYDAKEAVHHLFKVVSGLDSLVVGESEVLGQVKSAYQLAQQHGSTGKITNVLFQRALFVGKTVRTNTNISEGASSVGAVAVQLAERIFGKLNNHRVLLLGAGEIAEVTARHLLSQKIGQLVVLNRTLAHAKALAGLLNGAAASLDVLPEELAKADIVICSATVQKPLIRKEMIGSLMKERRMRSLYFIDIAVPRNVEPEVHGVDNVYVYNIDDLKGIVEENMGHRKELVTEAGDLVRQMTDEFYEWLKATLSGQDRALRHSHDHDR